MEIVDFLPIEKFSNALQKCDLFITHAGEGNIGQALQFRKRMILVPRKKELNEHTDNHQEEMAGVMGGNAGVIVVRDVSHLEGGIRLALTHEVEGAYKGYIPQILESFTHAKGITPTRALVAKGKWKPPSDASIVVATLNGGEPLIKAVKGMLAQDYKGKYEVIVVDDGSFDGVTPDLLRKNFAKTSEVTLIFLPRGGVCKARNAGIRAAKYGVIVNMDHDDNPEKDWLRIMMSGFDSPRVGAVSAYGHYGGTSTAFRKDLLDHLGGYDEDFFYYREDTDLSFRIMELGFDYRKVDGAKWHGDRTLVTPKGVMGLVKYALQRYKYHMNDVLLHKKHSTFQLCNDFLHVKGRIFVDPVEDFKVATGLWKNPDKEPELSSPRGMTFVPRTGFVSFCIILAGGLAYAFVMKWARLAGSLKHGHLLV
jgi:glycosyltransferase involved in cell wall biosynthesis